MDALFNLYDRDRNGCLDYKEFSFALYNKDVTGPYGRAFHIMDDLVIEGIDLCGDDFLSITIGS